MKHAVTIANLDCLMPVEKIVTLPNLNYNVKITKHKFVDALLSLLTDPLVNDDKNYILDQVVLIF